jgi:hypothetical protein
MFEDVLLDWGIDDINQDTVYDVGAVSDWAGEELPSSFLLNLTSIQDQRKYKYKNWCTRAGWSHWVNETNWADTTNWNPLWTYAVEKLKAEPNFGSSMTSFLQQAKNSWIITGYANVNKDNLYLIKQRIYNRKPIYSGSNKIDRAKMLKDGAKTAYISSGQGHIFIFDWRDDTLWVLIARDSFWNLRWDWRFYVKYEDIKHMYTFITCTTPDEHKHLKAVYDEQSKQLAISKWITNGKDQDKNTTRWQVAIMIWRIKYGLRPDEELLYQTAHDKIWNWENEDAIITREQMILMFGRLMWYKWTDREIVYAMVLWGYTNWMNLSNNVTREQAMIMAWRILLSKEKKHGN